MTYTSRADRLARAREIQTRAARSDRAATLGALPAAAAKKLRELQGHHERAAKHLGSVERHHDKLAATASELRGLHKRLANRLSDQDGAHVARALADLERCTRGLIETSSAAGESSAAASDYVAKASEVTDAVLAGDVGE